MKELFSKRLKAARKMRGLSMDELVNRMQGIVSKQSISKYEQGKMMPGSSILIAISKALQLPVDYFFRKGIEIEQINFRRDERLPSRSTEEMVYMAQDKVERYLIIEDLLAISSTFKNPLGKRLITLPEDAEEAAKTLRSKWSLGIHPIFSVYEMLESAGAKVLEFDAGNESVLGFSTLVNHNIPLIVVNSTNTTIERKRFTALHELAHLLLSFPSDLPEDKKERLCHRFAGAVLCPASVLYNEWGHHRTAFTLNELISLKVRYGISISAIVHRAVDLKIITNTYYNQIYDQCIHQNLLETGWGTYPIAEHTDRFERLLQRAVAEEIISLSRAAELSNEKLGEYREKLKFVV